MWRKEPFCSTITHWRLASFVLISTSLTIACLSLAAFSAGSLVRATAGWVWGSSVRWVWGTSWATVTQDGVQGVRTALEEIFCPGAVPQSTSAVSWGRWCEHCSPLPAAPHWHWVFQYTIETFGFSLLIFYSAYLKCLLLEAGRRENFLPTTCFMSR